MIIVSTEVTKDIQVDMAKSIIHYDTQYLESKHSGKFVSNLTYDIGLITNMVSTGILNLMKDSFTLIGLLTGNVLSKLEIIFNGYFNDTFGNYRIKIFGKENEQSYHPGTRKKWNFIILLK